MTAMLMIILVARVPHPHLVVLVITHVRAQREIIILIGHVVPPR